MIGIVGAGVIVTAAHLPAYAKLTLPVVALHDVDAARAQAVARQWNLAYVPVLEDLLSDPRVEIVDIAVPPAAQVPIAEAALRAGKHVLAQKPLAPTLAEATRIVELAHAVNRYLVVNQQMRWSPIVRAMRAAIADGSVGTLEWLAFDTNISMAGGDSTHWLAREPRLIVLLNTIHLLDTSRFLLGEPSSLVAAVRRGDQHLDFAGETGVLVALEFAGGKQAWIVDQWNGVGDHHAAFQASGPGGAMRGHFGLWTNYPAGADDQVEYTPREGPPVWKPVAVEGRWIPDAFIGPVGELVAAINGGAEPMTSGRDHLRTLALVDAVYESAAAGRRVAFEMS